MWFSIILVRPSPAALPLETKNSDANVNRNWIFPRCLADRVHAGFGIRVYQSANEYACIYCTPYPYVMAIL